MSTSPPSNNSKHTREAFGVTLLKSSHPEIRRLKKSTEQAQFHGNKFWNASLVMMDYLSEYPPAKNMQVLEIGCGWGAASIFCAKHFNAQCIALDADDSVFPYLELHTAMNQVSVDSVQMNLADITEDQLANFDLVIAADICFWDELTEQVGQLIDRAINAEVPRILLTDPGRPGFRELAEHYSQYDEVTYTDWAVPSPHNAWGLVLDINNQ